MRPEDSKLGNLYREVIMDHYHSPRGEKALESPDVSNTGTNPLCGDEVELGLKVENGRISRVHVHGRGCSISVASGSMLAELLEGKTIREAEAVFEAFRGMMRGTPAPAGLDLGDLESLEGVRSFPVRIKCALLPWTTLNDALKALQEGKNRPEEATTTETGEHET